MTEKDMKKELEKIAERVAQKHTPNVLNSESAKENLYKVITWALGEIKRIGNNQDNKSYHSQISTVHRFFKDAQEAYGKNDFPSFKDKTGYAINELWKIINREEVSCK